MRGVRSVWMSRMARKRYWGGVMIGFVSYDL